LKLLSRLEFVERVNTDVVGEHCPCQSSHEAELKTIFEDFADLSADKEARLDGVDGHVALSVLHWGLHIFVRLVVDELALDDLRTLTFDQHVHQLADLVSVIVLALHETLSAIFESQIEHVALLFLGLHDGLEEHSWGDLLGSERLVDDFRRQTQLHFTVHVPARFGLVHSCTFRKHCSNDKLTLLELVVLAVTRERNEAFGVASVVHDRILAVVHFRHGKQCSAALHKFQFGDLGGGDFRSLERQLLGLILSTRFHFSFFGVLLDFGII